MSVESIGVGVIGCGEVAQLMHLPCLQELPEFHIAGVCDISAGTARAVADHYHVGAWTTDHRALLADPDMRAVVVCTYDHAGIAADCLAAGKHLIVEKPLAFTPEEAAPLVAAAEASGLVALIGTMKLYDDGYRRAAERLRGMGPLRSIQVHDLAGRFDRYGALYTQTRIADVPAETLAAAREDVTRRIEAALGERHAGYVDLYLILLMLGSHDLAVMRGLFGAPERVAFARPVGARQLLAVLDYPGDVPCVLEIGVGTAYEWWDEWIAAQSGDAALRLEFQNPYVRQAQTLVRVREAAGDTASERVIFGVPDSPFRRQWRHFAACVAGTARPVTPWADGLADLRLAVEIIRAMPPRPRGAACA
jgi:predicted dehydrogenase